MAIHCLPVMVSAPASCGHRGDSGIKQPRERLTGASAGYGDREGHSERKVTGTAPARPDQRSRSGRKTDRGAAMRGDGVDVEVARDVRGTVEGVELPVPGVAVSTDGAAQ